MTISPIYNSQLYILRRTLPSPPYSGRTPADSDGLRRSLVSSVGLKFAEKLYYRNIFSTPNYTGISTEYHCTPTGLPPESDEDQRTAPYSYRTPPDSGEFGGTQIGRETVLSKYVSHAFGESSTILALTL